MLTYAEVFIPHDPRAGVCAPDRMRTLMDSVLARETESDMHVQERERDSLYIRMTYVECA